MASSNRQIRRKRHHVSKQTRRKGWKCAAQDDQKHGRRIAQKSTWGSVFFDRYVNRQPVDRRRTSNLRRFSIVEGVRRVVIYTLVFLGLQVDRVIGVTGNSHGNHNSTGICPAHVFAHCYVQDKPPDICLVQTHLIDHAGQSTLLRYKRAPAPQVADSSSAASSASGASPRSTGTQSSSVPRSPPASPSSLSSTALSSSSPSSASSHSTVSSGGTTTSSAPAATSGLSTTAPSTTTTSRPSTTTTTIAPTSTTSSTKSTTTDPPAAASPAAPSSPRRSITTTTSKSGTASSSANFAAPANSSSMATDGNVMGYIYGPASSGAVRRLARPWEWTVNPMSWFRLGASSKVRLNTAGSEFDSIVPRMGYSRLNWFTRTKSVDAKLKLEILLEEFDVAVRGWKSEYNKLEELRALQMQIGLVEGAIKQYERKLVEQQRWSYITRCFVWKKPSADLASGIDSAIDMVGDVSHKAESEGRRKGSRSNFSVWWMKTKESSIWGGLREFIGGFFIGFITLNFGLWVGLKLLMYL
ncbi:hypothetical protein BJ742DRAFT_809112 [Cladochytrium replicatum]|nr:hypothetical protein BJ742DRAFT_809112 [Cladochytrium replicatum]